MLTKDVDVAIVGGGPAGMAAALGAAQNGAAKVLLIERDVELGGILRQCVHEGFQLELEPRELSGPDYAQVFIDKINERENIEVMLDTMAIDISQHQSITVVNPAGGVTEIKARAVVLAMGCRERTRGMIKTPGARIAGVFTAGIAQRMVNIEGYLPGKNIVIIGSGDIGLIMAKRLCEEGANVKAVLEIMPYSNGLENNIAECLDDLNIPLLLSRTVTHIHGRNRVTGITHSLADAELKPVPGTEEDIACDCVLFSIGLIPENELSKKIAVVSDQATGGPCVDQLRQTSADGFFAAGNVLQVHDLVGFVSREGELAGKSAALYASGLLGGRTEEIMVDNKSNAVRSVVPQKVTRYSGLAGNDVRLYIRPSEILRNAVLEIKDGEKTILRQNIPVVRPNQMIMPELSLSEVTANCKSLDVFLGTSKKNIFCFVKQDSSDVALDKLKGQERYFHRFCLY